MHTALVIIQVLVAVGVVALVLLQQGKGADAGAAFGAGASGSVFGARGSATFLSRATGILAAVFMLVSLALAYLVHDRAQSDSVVDRVAAEPAGPEGAAPVPPESVLPPEEAAPAGVEVEPSATEDSPPEAAQIPE